MLSQPPAPARLGWTKHTTTDLFAAGQLENGSRKITGYRIGWTIDFPGKERQVKLSDWWNLPTGVQPGGTADIPAQGVSFSLIEQGAVRVEFFVAAVKFADGTVWEANLEEIKKIAPAGGASP